MTDDFVNYTCEENRASPGRCGFWIHDQQVIRIGPSPLPFLQSFAFPLGSAKIGIFFILVKERWRCNGADGIGRL